MRKTGAPRRIARRGFVILLAALLATPGPGAAANAGLDADDLNAALEAIQREANEVGALGVYQAVDGTYVIVLPRDARVAVFDEVTAPGLQVRTDHAAVTADEIERISSILAAREWSERASALTYSYGFVPSEGQVLIHSDASAAQFQPVLDKFPGLVRHQSVAGMSRVSRYTSTAPHLGGAAINGTMIDGQYGRCTTGFTVNKGGILYMLTAGHCFSIGARPISPGSGLVVGQVAFRAAFPQRDMELLGGSNYGGSIYIGTTGTAMRVSSAGDPNWSYTNYCYSGSVTYEQCGKSVYQSAVSFCDVHGCTFNLVSMTGGSMPEPGDSGAPVYTKGSTVGIRGMLIARNSRIMYLEKWSTIANTLAVSVYAP